MLFILISDCFDAKKETMRTIFFRCLIVGTVTFSIVYFTITLNYRFPYKGKLYYQTIELGYLEE